MTTSLIMHFKSYVILNTVKQIKLNNVVVIKSHCDIGHAVCSKKKWFEYSLWWSVEIIVMKCRNHCIVLTGPITNAKLTMVPPGIVNPEVKYKLPLQPLQRVFHADSQEGGGQASLNILLHGENDEPEVRTGEQLKRSPQVHLFVFVSLGFWLRMIVFLKKFLDYFQ